MGRDLLNYPMVKEMYELASSILGYNLLSLCLDGPKKTLDQTLFCQPAILVASLASLQKLKALNPEAVENCVATAGFSVGELAALVFSKALTFENGKYKFPAVLLKSTEPSGLSQLLFSRQTSQDSGRSDAVGFGSNSFRDDDRFLWTRLEFEKSM